MNQLENIINKTAQFFNDFPILGGIIIVVLIVVLLQFYNLNNCSEYFTPTNQTTIISTNNPNPVTSTIHSETITDKIFNKYYNGVSKLINFKCTFNGKEYYLVNLRMYECEKQPVAKDALPQIDCTKTTLALMEVSEVENKLNNYLSDLKIKEILCETEKKLKCQVSKGGVNSLSNTASIKFDTSCSEEKPHADCAANRMFIHDFVVTEYKSDKPETKRFYILKGTNTPKLPNTIVNNSIVSAYKFYYFLL